MIFVRDCCSLIIVWGRRSDRWGRSTPNCYPVSDNLVLKSTSSDICIIRMVAQLFFEHCTGSFGRYADHLHGWIKHYLDRVQSWAQIVSLHGLDVKRRLFLTVPKVACIKTRNKATHGFYFHTKVATNSPIGCRKQVSDRPVRSFPPRPGTRNLTPNIYYKTCYLFLSHPTFSLPHPSPRDI